MAARLSPAMLGDDALIEQDVKAGKLALMEWGGSLLTVIEKRGPLMVICCAAGGNLAAYLNSLYRLAKRNDCRVIQFHSKRKGLARMAKRFNPVQVGRDEHNQIIYQIGVR